MARPGLRLGVYADIRYGPTNGERSLAADSLLAADSAFVPFLTALRRHVADLVLFGRGGAIPTPLAFVDRSEITVVSLPDYPSLASVGAVARATVPSRRVWRDHLADLDALIVFGPHPIGALLAADARARRLPVVLGVRQDLPAYLGPRVAASRRRAVVGSAHALEFGWQAMARRVPTIVTGADLAARYRGTPRLLDVAFSLVDQDHLVAPEQLAAPDWKRPLRVLSIGRLDPEKNPLLLADVAAGLDRVSPGSRLRVVGDGSCRAELHRLATDRNLPIDLVGAVPHGEAVWAELAEADALVHVSHTEGQPQVVLEAMAAAVPIVATAVGGVPAMLGHGARGLLVRPDDAGAIVEALSELRDDRVRREHLVLQSSTWVTRHTLEAESRRVVEFVRECVHEFVGEGRR